MYNLKYFYNYSIIWISIVYHEKHGHLYNNIKNMLVSIWVVIVLLYNNYRRL